MPPCNEVSTKLHVLLRSKNTEGRLMDERSSKDLDSYREHEERNVADVKEYNVSISAITEAATTLAELLHNLQDRFTETVSGFRASCALFYA